jgi:ribosomal protein S18 acetylase RimI-like enzyme
MVGSGLYGRKKVKIKAINGSEIECIRKLRDTLNIYHTAKSTHFQDHFSKYTFEKWVERMNRRDRLMTYVAQDKDENVGFCMATIDGLVGEIASLFVSEPYRDRRLGEELISLALKWLEDQECEAIRVSVVVGNERVIDFYRRFGFAERIVVMQRNP